MPMQTRRWLLVCLGAALFAHAVGAQQPSGAAPATGDGMVTLNLPEQLPLKTLIDYVSQRNNISFIYDRAVATRQVTIKAPSPIPAESVMTLLESLLRINGFVMTETDVQGVIRIEPVKELAAVTDGPKATAQGERPSQAVTRVMSLKHITPKRAQDVLSVFMPAQGSGIIPLPEHNLMIVTDYAGNMKRIEEVLALIDRPAREAAVKIVPLQHTEVRSAIQAVNQLLAAIQRTRNPDGGGQAEVVVMGDERTNRIFIVGLADRVGQAADVVKSLDSPLGLETKIYRFSAASAEQVDAMIEPLIGAEVARRLYRSSVDADTNMLVATTTADIHKQIDELHQALDRPLVESQSPIRFYKLENAKAAEVLTTLQSLAGDGGLGDVSIDGVKAGAADEAGIFRGPTPEQVNRTASVDDRPAAKPVGLADARIMADEATNTIIIVATPAMHPVYEKLIRKLDERQPQVLVEATIVSIDTTNNFQLGVEIHNRELGVNGGELFNFTQFGLSTRNATTGQFTLNPGLGFTGALLNADVAEVVIRALESDQRVKVLSRPSVLINDNQEGVLESKSEEPYTTQNSNGVSGSTVSFGGFASAGTEVKITPQISEGDHLKLKYAITLSSFGDDGTDALPPSRQTNSLASEVTIPDGATIVVGGLTRETLSETVDRIPFLGSIPIVELLFSSRTKTQSKATLFLFIKAVVLRDDKFKDLKMLSTTAAGQAELAADFPVSQPVSIQ